MLDLALLPRGMLTSIMLLGLLSLVLIWGNTIYDCYLDRQRAEAHARTATLSLAIALREHAQMVLANADHFLRQLSEAYLQSAPATFTMPSWIAKSNFVKNIAIQIGVLDADGKSVGSTLPGAIGTDFSDRRRNFMSESRS